MTRRFDQAWDLMLMAITLSALATPATAESDSEKERTEDCATAVMTEYVKANDALLQETATVMSVEATIAQRRLQEEYCLRFVRCSLDDQNSAIFRVQFDSCLKDEALEKYGAIPGVQNQLAWPSGKRAKFSHGPCDNRDAESNFDPQVIAVAKEMFLHRLDCLD